MAKKVKQQNKRKLNAKSGSTSYLPLQLDGNGAFQDQEPVKVTASLNGKQYQWSGKLVGTTANFAYAQLTCTTGDRREDKGWSKGDESVTVTIDGGDTPDTKVDVYSE